MLPAAALTGRTSIRSTDGMTEVGAHRKAFESEDDEEHNAQANAEYITLWQLGKFPAEEQESNPHCPSNHGANGQSH